LVYIKRRPLKGEKFRKRLPFGCHAQGKHNTRKGKQRADKRGPLLAAKKRGHEKFQPRRIKEADLWKRRFTGSGESEI